MRSRSLPTEQDVVPQQCSRQLACTHHETNDYTSLAATRGIRICRKVGGRADACRWRARCGVALAAAWVLSLPRQW